MSLDYINEAFKKLDLLTEDVFDTSLTGINNLSTFMNDTSDDDIIRVVDDEATSEEELKDSYVGKVIVNCNICHSHIFKNKEDINVDPEGIVNGDEQCPYCGEQDGFTVVGEIAPYAPEAETTTDDAAEDVTEVEVDDTAVELEEDFNDEFIPKLTEKLKSKGINPDLITVAPAKFGNFKIDFDDTTINSKDLVNKTKEAITELGYTAAVEFNGEAVEILKLELKSKALDEDFTGEFIPKLTEKLKSKGIDTNLITVAPAKFGNFKIDFDDTTINSKDLVNKTQQAISELGYTASVEFNGEVVEILKLEIKAKDLGEDFKNVSITTDDQHLEMSSDDNGKVTVTTEPIEETALTDDEMIVPVSDETQTEIEANNEDAFSSDMDAEVEMTSDVAADEEDIDFEDIDEESIDELGESYLKKVYENVNSFKTTDVFSTADNKLIVEGTLKFNSGVEKKTGFIFEAKDVNAEGALRFTGFNKHLTESKDAYTLVGSINKDKVLVLESLKYNYSVGDAPVRGIVRKSSK